MKLGELKSLIRSREGNPMVLAQLGGQLVQVTVQKKSIMEALDTLFTGRGTETGLILNDDGLLSSEGAPRVSTAAPETESSDDLDDLDSLPELSLDEVRLPTAAAAILTTE